MNVKNMRIEEERPEVMQPIEEAVQEVYAAHPDLTDRDVDLAFGALITEYRARERGLESQHRLPGDAQTLFATLRPVADELLATGVADVPLLVRGLTRLRKSVGFWTKRGGRQGYLNSVGQLLP